MMADDLLAELAHTQDPLGPTWYARFRELGFPDRVIFGVRPLIGVGRIVTHSDGLFEFHDDGEVALVVPEGEPESPGWAVVPDLIAFKPSEPGRWWLRRGQVDLLGAYNMAPWKLSPTTIHETPLSWLRAGADGICIVDWGLDPATALLPAGDLVAETPALEARLECRITEAALEPFKIAVAQAAAQAGDLEARHAA